MGFNSGFKGLILVNRHSKLQWRYELLVLLQTDSPFCPTVKRFPFFPFVAVRWRKLWLTLK